MKQDFLQIRSTLRKHLTLVSLCVFGSQVVIVVETEKDNSVPPAIPDPTPPPPPERGTCEIPGVPVCEHDEEPINTHHAL